MKRKYLLAVSIAVIFAFTSLAFAQGQFYAENSNSWVVDAVDSIPAAAPDRLASVSHAPFYAESANSWQPLGPDTSAGAAREYYGKNAIVTVKAAMTLAGATLNPGEYDVRYVDSTQGHHVKFSKTVENDFAPEGMSVYETKVVAEVSCTMEQLNSVVAHTELLPGGRNTVARLEIRGEKVVHLF